MLNDPSDKLREALDTMFRAGTCGSSCIYERGSDLEFTTARAAVEALFAELTRERDEALTNVKVAELGERNAREALAQARRAPGPDGLRNGILGLRSMLQRENHMQGVELANSLLDALAAPQPPAQEGES